MRYWAISGRVCGADEDSTYIFQAPGHNEAADMFFAEMTAGTPQDGIDARTRETGIEGGVFVNSIVYSETEIFES